MGKVIDITSKLTNEAPVLKLNGKSYEVDNRKNTVLKLNDEMEKKGASMSYVLDKTLGLLLGDTAAKEINELNLRMDDLITVFTAVMALATGDELEEVEERFQKSKKE